MRRAGKGQQVLRAPKAHPVQAGKAHKARKARKARKAHKVRKVRKVRKAQQVQLRWHWSTASPPSK